MSGVVVRSNRIPAFRSGLEKTVMDFTGSLPEAMADRMKEKILDGPKTGIVYPSGHQASAPGEAPANETGALVESIEVDGNTLRVNAEYGPALEYGTSRMAARPFFNASIDEVRAEKVDELFQAIQAITRGLASGRSAASIGSSVGRFIEERDRAQEDG